MYVRAFLLILLEFDPAFVGAVKTHEEVRVLNDLGVLCWHAGDAPAALRWFQQALQSDPRDEATLHNCADVLAALGQGDEARRLLTARRAPVRRAA